MAQNEGTNSVVEKLIIHKEYLDMVCRGVQGESRCRFIAIHILYAFCQTLYAWIVKKVQVPSWPGDLMSD